MRKGLLLTLAVVLSSSNYVAYRGPQKTLT